MSEAKQDILNHLSEQFRLAQAEALERLESRLAEAILRLQKDDVLDRMNSDPTLQQFKMARIREICQDTFTGERQLSAQALAITELKNHVFLVEVERSKDIQIWKRKEQDHIQMLNDVEEKYMRYSEQVKEQITKHRQTIEELNGECDLKDQKIRQLESNLSSNEALVQTMQSDMSTVRNKWEQRCKDIEDQWRQKLKSDVDQLKKHYQLKLDSMVMEYAKCVKEGSPMIVQADEELITSLKKDLKELRSRCAQAELMVEEQSREMEIMSRENTQYKESIHEYRERQSRIVTETRSSHEKYQQLMRALQEKSDDCKRLSKEVSVYRKEVEQLKVDLQKHERIKHELEEEHLKELERIRDQVEQQSEDNRERQSTQLQSTKDLLRQRNNELEELQLEVQSLKKTESRLKAQISTRDQTIIEQETRLASDKMKLRTVRQNQRKVMRAIEQISLPVQRLKSQNSLLKEQVKYELETYKRRLQTELIGIIDRVVLLKEKAEKDSAQKMMTLLAQVEQTNRRETSQFEKVRAQNEDLNVRLTQYEKAFEEKLVEIKEDVRAKDSASLRLMEQLDRAKGIIAKLQMEKEEQTRELERELKQFKKSIISTIRGRKQTFTQILYDMISEELRMREKETEKAKFENRQKEDMVSELEMKLQQSRGREEDLKDRLSELEVLRNRCYAEEQSRRKLEKELKDLRLELLTKEGTISQLTKLRREKENISRNHKDDKERELEEIRAMIVKTYEVVGGRPSHDVPERGKRTAK